MSQLPPKMIDNTDRAAAGLTAVEAFREGGLGSPNMAEAVGYLIGNLMHLCVQQGIDPFKIVEQGACYFIAEAIDPDSIDYEARFHYTASWRYGSRGPFRLFYQNPPKAEMS
jgi:hypothetical protein